MTRRSVTQIKANMTDKVINGVGLKNNFVYRVKPEHYKFAGDLVVLLSDDGSADPCFVRLEHFKGMTDGARACESPDYSYVYNNELEEVSSLTKYNEKHNGKRVVVDTIEPGEERKVVNACGIKNKMMYKHTSTGAIFILTYDDGSGMPSFTTLEHYTGMKDFKGLNDLWIDMDNLKEYMSLKKYKRQLKGEN